ncbi:hypothetical protein STEG23_013761 [Scotinomys teguina]
MEDPGSDRRAVSRGRCAEGLRFVLVNNFNTCSFRGQSWLMPEWLQDMFVFIGHSWGSERLRHLLKAAQSHLGEMRGHNLTDGVKNIYITTTIIITITIIITVIIITTIITIIITIIITVIIITTIITIITITTITAVTIVTTSSSITTTTSNIITITNITTASIITIIIIISMIVCGCYHLNNLADGLFVSCQPGSPEWHQPSLL